MCPVIMLFMILQLIDSIKVIIHTAFVFYIWIDEIS